MDRSQLLRGALDAAVLAVTSEDDAYGYDVLRRLRSAGLAEVGDASVYGTLRRLYTAGALTLTGVSCAPSRVRLSRKTRCELCARRNSRPASSSRSSPQRSSFAAR